MEILVRKEGAESNPSETYMKKKFVLVGLLLCLSFMFTLTLFFFDRQNSVEITPITENETKKISFLSSWGGYDTKSPRIKKIFNIIGEKNHSYEIEDASMSGEDFLFILKTDFASGNEPDIFGLWPGSDFNLLVSQGKVADLTQLLKEDPEWYHRFKPETWDYVTVNDHIYGLPIEMIYEGVFINTDLFEKYEVKVPSNFSELLEAVAIFKENGIIPIAYSQTPEGSYIYQNMVMKLGGKDGVEHPFDDEGHIKDCFIQGMYYMKQLYDAGAFPKQLYHIDDKTRNELFLHKKAAMIVQGSWFIGEGAVASNDTTVDIIPFPDMPEGKAASSAIIYGCGNGIFHMSERAYQDSQINKECIQLLKQMTSPENVAIFAADSGFISNVELGEYAPPPTIMSQKGEALVAQSDELVGAVDWFINRNTWENIIINHLPDVLRGTLTPEQVFEMAEADAMGQ